MGMDYHLSPDNQVLVTVVRDFEPTIQKRLLKVIFGAIKT